MKPFAIQLYERFATGESIEQLAAVYNISVERITMRIRAAEKCILAAREGPLTEGQRDAVRVLPK